MAKRLAIGSGQSFAATTAGSRQARNDGLALFAGDQGLFMLGVARLTADGPFGLGLIGDRLGVRMPGGRGLGGVGRVPAELGFQLGDAGFESCEAGFVDRKHHQQFRLGGGWNGVPEFRR